MLETLETLESNRVSWYNIWADRSKLLGLFLLPNSFTNAIIINRAVVTKGPDLLLSATVRAGTRNYGFLFGQKNRTDATNIGSGVNYVLKGHHQDMEILAYSFDSVNQSLLSDFSERLPTTPGLSAGDSGCAGGGQSPDSLTGRQASHILAQSSHIPLYKAGPTFAPVGPATSLKENG